MKRFLIGGTAVLLLLTSFALLWGIQRYGSVQGLARRLQAEVAPEPARPTAAPTIIPSRTINAQAFAQQLATPTLEPTATYTPLPPTLPPEALSVTQTAAPVPPTPTNTPTPIYAPIKTATRLLEFTHIWQGWNNCAPATLTSNLSFYGLAFEQDDVAATLKPNENDKNVTPAEIATFAHEQGLEARIMINGQPETMKRLLSNGIPIMIETWLEEDLNDGMGHYRMLIGYDDTSQQWVLSDSYISKDVELPYEGIQRSYDEVDRLWEVFNRTYILIYPPQQTFLVSAIIGDDWQEPVMWRNALDRYRTEIQTDSENPFIWHNLGMVLAELGEAEQAALAFDQARFLGLPWRMFWYQFGVMAVYAENGRYQDLLDLTTATIQSGGSGEEIYYWQGVAFMGLGRTAEAQQAWGNALWWNETYQPAQEAMAQN